MSLLAIIPKKLLNSEKREFCRTPKKFQMIGAIFELEQINNLTINRKSQFRVRLVLGSCQVRIAFLAKLIIIL
jgi:hypothetical protein